MTGEVDHGDPMIFQWAQLAFHNHRGPEEELAPFCPTLFGAALLRRGHYEVAVRYFQNYPEISGTTWDWLFLCLPHQPLEQFDKAQPCFDQARHRLEEHVPFNHPRIPSETSLPWPQHPDLKNLCKQIETRFPKQ